MLMDHLKRQNKIMEKAAFDAGWFRGAITGASVMLALCAVVLVFALFVASRASGG